MIRRALVFLVCAIALALAGPGARAQGADVLWYGAPARDWEREGLPIGNGAMGAMIMGAVASDRIQFNEKTLWTGGPGSAEGYDFGWPERSLRRELDAVRRDLAARGRLEPEAVARRLGRETKGYGHYQSFGELVLDFPGLAGAVSGYRRELEISRAVARMTFVRGGVRYTREYFASYPDQIIVMRITADRLGAVSFAASLALPDNRSVRRGAADGRISAGGALRDNGLKYYAAIQILNEGGRRTDRADGSVAVEGANAATIILGAGTNYAMRYPAYRGADPDAGVAARVDRAAAKGYARLASDHEADYRVLYDRVALDIGQRAPDIPTDRLLANYGSGGVGDRALEALYFQYGRYLLIASSRAGSLPANLQGVWNNSATPPWNGDYHVNINLQMNYWLAETTNLQETTAPMFDFVDALVEPGRRSAERIAGARGWTLFLNTNVWGFTGVISWPTAFWQPEAGAWLAQHYWEHYLFTRDEAFLRTRAYPVMKGAAEFWLDALVVDRDGKLVVSPSYSPEHGPFSEGAAMSQQIVADLFANVSEAAEVLGDRAFRVRIEAARVGLDPGLRIGSWGQLQEWRADWDERADDHRHVSHLFALHPGRAISPSATPALAEAARVSLDARGDGGTGWSKAWKINFWARLHDGARAHRLLTEQLRGSTLANLLDTHPPFQIDGNFGASAGVAEMLLQSQTGEIEILPALPPAWASGSVRGLRARGDATVDIAWANGAASEVRLRAGRAGPVTLRSTLFGRVFAFTEGGRAVALEGEGAVRTFRAEAGRVYVLKGQS